MLNIIHELLIIYTIESTIKNVTINRITFYPNWIEHIKLNFQTPFYTFITIYTFRFRLQITISPFLLSIARNWWHYLGG